MVRRGNERGERDWEGNGVEWSTKRRHLNEEWWMGRIRGGERGFTCPRFPVMFTYWSNAEPPARSIKLNMVYALFVVQTIFWFVLLKSASDLHTERVSSVLV